MFGLVFGLGLGRGLQLGLGFGPLEGEDRRGFFARSSLSGFFDVAFSRLEGGEERLGLLQYNHKTDARHEAWPTYMGAT